MYQLVVEDVVVDVIRKKIKNLRLSIHPPEGYVRISVPLHVDDEAVRLLIMDKLPWIKSHQRKFEEKALQTTRCFLSGENHYFQGQPYLLNVIYADAVPNVNIREHKYIDLQVRPNSDEAKRAEILREWYRYELKQILPPLIQKWEPIMGVKVKEWRIKQMKTRWGTCNPVAHRIWFNLELAKKPPACVEYLTVHEMVHLLERSHNARFKHLMSEFLPNWRTLRDQLNRHPS